jgi:hypothetical protein
VRRTAAALAALTVASLAACLAGCSKNNETAPPPPPAKGTVHVAPSQSNVLIRGTQDFTATLSGVADSAVTWRLLREPGVNDTVDVGTIVSTGARSAHYTAPPTVETPGLDLAVTVQAVDVADTTVRGSATVVVPRVQMTIVPNSVTSVPPGTLVPFAVTVYNAVDKTFSLTVDGIDGGDAGVGTWVQTGPTSTLYTAPSRDTLFLYSLLGRSSADPGIFGSAIAIVRAGFAVSTTDPTRSEYAPEWDPVAARVAFVRGGPSWDLVVYDFVSQTEQVLTSFSWSGNTYDGRIAWSEDGAQLAFSEQSGGHRVIGLVNADGSARSSFAPDPATDYDEACFFTVASPAAESLYVAQQGAAGSELRAYPLVTGPGEMGRLIHQAAAGAVIRSPDARQLPVVIRPSVAFAEVSNNFSQVLSTNDTGNGLLSTAASGAGVRSQVRWVLPSDGVPWITYVDPATQNLYRAQRGGATAQRVYTDFFPESGGDLKADPPTAFHFLDAHVVARLEPDGHTRLWVIGFPPSNIVPVTRALEAELRRAGVWQALSPSAWRRWRFGVGSL